jgi:phenylacetate-CoA ligase
VPGTFFAHYLKEFDHAIKQFQVVQERPGAIGFRVVRGGRFSEDVLQEVLARFRDVLGHELEIDVEFVDEVAMIRTGKRIAAVSKLGIDFQRAGASVRPSGEAERS